VVDAAEMAEAAEARDNVDACRLRTVCSSRTSLTARRMRTIDWMMIVACERKTRLSCLALHAREGLSGMQKNQVLRE